MLKVKNMKILFSMLFLLIAMPALADEASHRQAAEEYIAVSDAREGLNVTVNYMLEQQTIPKNRDIARVFYSKYLNWDDLKNDFVKMAMDNFSEQELKELIAFCKTPIGKKVVALKAHLSVQTWKMFQDRIEPHWSQFQSDIEALEKSQHEEKKPQHKNAEPEDGEQ